VESVESDSWGRPYKIVTNKLRPSAPPLTANMDPVLLDNVIGTLFPRQDSCAGQPGPSSSTTSDDDDGVASTATEWSEELRVTEEELFEATRRMASRDVAPVRMESRAELGQRRWTPWLLVCSISSLDA
jgi:hypothetical protein